MFIYLALWHKKTVKTRPIMMSIIFFIKGNFTTLFSWIGYFSLFFQIMYATEGDALAGISVYLSDTPDWRSGTLCNQYNIV